MFVEDLLLILVLGVTISSIFAVVVQTMAKRIGTQYPGYWFWVGFFLWMLGLAFVLMKEGKTAVSESDNGE